MAEILFKATDNTHTDPVIDARGCYKYGDPVVVLPDGHKFGRSEGLPTFLQVYCPDVSVEEVRYILDSLTEQVTTLDSEGHPNPPDTLLRKRYGFNLTELPDQYKNKLFGSGRAEVPFYILKGTINYKG